MGFRFSTSAAISLALLSIQLSSQTLTPAGNSDPGWIATIQVQVRDGNGRPISGLGPDDFILTEQGEHDTIITVQSLAGPMARPASRIEGSKTPRQTKAQASSPSEIRPHASTKAMNTWVLIVLAPMSAFGRHFAISGLQKFLRQPHPRDWVFALFDDAGEFLPFTGDTEALRARLDFLEHHTISQQFYDGPWTSKADRAVQELGIKPGRRAIVLASDFAFDVSEPRARDPRRLLLSPLSFIDAALRAQAPIYTLQASGPGTVVPFGSAETQAVPQPWTSEAGLIVADQINSDLWSVGKDFAEFLEAADETGGRPARDMQDAFAKIAADADGFYRITFRPRMSEPDGALHPITVAVRTPGAHVHSTSYYVAPTGESRQRLPATIRAALDKGTITQGLTAAAHVWLFPDARGVRTGVMAADISWPAEAGKITPGSKLQIYAQLIDQAMGRMVGSWLSEGPWNTTEGHPPSVHWQYEAPLYPGTYLLRVVALDAASGKIGTREFAFVVYPSFLPAFRLSDIVVASRCLDESEMQGRTNLLDPMLLDGCLLSPSAAGSFSATESPTMLVRLYTTDQELRDTFLKQWKAYVAIGDGPRIPLPIQSADIRGLMATGKLDLAKLGAKPGTNPIVVMFETPADHGKVHAVALRSQLTLNP